jgi:hypothetical protein
MRHIAHRQGSRQQRRRISDFLETNEPGYRPSAIAASSIKLRGRARVDAAFTLALAAYNLIRLPKLLEAQGSGNSDDSLLN